MISGTHACIGGGRFPCDSDGALVDGATTEVDRLRLGCMQGVGELSNGGCASSKLRWRVGCASGVHHETSWRAIPDGRACLCMRDLVVWHFRNLMLFDCKPAAHGSGGARVTALSSLPDHERPAPRLSTATHTSTRLTGGGTLSTQPSGANTRAFCACTADRHSSARSTALAMVFILC